jgi:phosphatidylglycerol lysyltransferase
MFGVQGRSWIALGDPVGAPDEAKQLARRFRDLARRHGGRTVFYEVLGDRLPIYVDLGLLPLKLGEEARVALPGFSLEGGARRSLRRSCASAEEAGVTFELVPADGVAALLPELRRVSSEWLARRSMSEKGFSLGWFGRDYLVRFPVAIVRSAQRIVAFANVWLHEPPASTTEGPSAPTPSREEISVDLMRHSDDAPSGTMDFLFARLMELGRDRGFRWFNLGMAPFSGLESDPLAPLWHKLGSALYRHGEPLYHFQGLRQFKEKFDPVWRPRYLVSPGGLTLPAVLKDLVALVGSGPLTIE